MKGKAFRLPDPDSITAVITRATLRDSESTPQGGDPHHALSGRVEVFVEKQLQRRRRSRP